MGHGLFPTGRRSRADLGVGWHVATFAIEHLYRYCLPAKLSARLGPGRSEPNAPWGRVAVLIDFLLVVFICVDLLGLQVTVDDTLARLERAEAVLAGLRSALSA